MDAERKHKLDIVFLKAAENISTMSLATRSKVGAVLVKDGNTLSMGWNGMPSGMPNDEIELTIGTVSEVMTNPLVIHAEANAFDKLSRNGSVQGAEGATLYLTLTPCIECAKRIVNNKIARVVYRDVYRDPSPLEILRTAGVELVHIPRGEP